MSKSEEKRKAIELRTQGLSYREIRQQVLVSRSTLSLWLRSVGLAKAQRQRLTEKKRAAGLRGAAIVHAQRVERVRRIMSEARAEASRLAETNRLWLIGTVLYWAEGDKMKGPTNSAAAGFTNMDPCAILLMRQWLSQCCSVAEGDIVYALYIHERADIHSALAFWSQRLDIPRERIRLHLKKHNPLTRRKNIGEGYHGTMRMIVHRTALTRRIAGWIEGLVTHCGVG